MKVFNAADEYCKESNWKTLALLKFCLFAMGIMAGMSVPKEKKKVVYGVSGIVFIGTYIPLMTKFLRILLRKEA